MQLLIKPQYCDGISFFPPTAPQPVLQLRVKQANESSLTIMWVTPHSDWDHYVVSLGHRSLTIVNRALAKEAKEFTYCDLTPGRKYTANVTTISGDLSNWTSIVGHTGTILSTYYWS